MSIEELIELVQLHGTSIYRFCYKLTDNADRGVYWAVSSGTAFYSDKAFGYDETTGMTYIKDDYEGAAVLYELPLDPNKADHAKAETYLQTLLQSNQSSQIEDKGNSTSDTTHDEMIMRLEIILEKLQRGEEVGITIEDSIAEVSYDHKGNITYSYKDYSVTLPLLQVFEEGETGFSTRKISISGNADNVYTALLFHRDGQGKLTGRFVI